MQRFFQWFFLFAALYVSGPACATEPVSGVPAQPAPHIALLLPLKSEAFGEAADAVRQGFLAAAGQAQGLPVRVYACADESKEVVPLYRQALAAGARAVVGPLTRNGVAALADYAGIIKPTLALNNAEGAGSEQLYFFGLTAELEARQIAQLAAGRGMRHAVTVSADSPLSRRLVQAFIEEWERLGGDVAREVEYLGDAEVFAGLAEMEGEAGMIFLAADARQAPLIRPYLGIAMPVYATSQVFRGNADTLANYDLNGVRFIDMPWLLQPDHPAVMIYPRAEPSLAPDMERLYALGIDAERLVNIMLEDGYQSALPLDGVTGRIRLNGRHQFQREAIPALFRQGRGLTPEQIAAEEAAARAAAAAAAASAVQEEMAPAP